jgi:chromosome segregation ATPase
MLTKEISEVEKEIESKEKRLRGLKAISDGGAFNKHQIQEMKCRIRELQAKLSTLKSAQAKFDKFVEDLKKELDLYQKDCMYQNHYRYCVAKLNAVRKIIDELSSKQEGKEW